MAHLAQNELDERREPKYDDHGSDERASPRGGLVSARSDGRVRTIRIGDRRFSLIIGSALFLHIVVCDNVTCLNTTQRSSSWPLVQGGYVLIRSTVMYVLTP